MAASILDNTPAMAPPPGMVSKLIDPPSQAASFLAMVIICLVLSTSTFLMRIYTKLFLLRRHGWDDYVSHILYPLVMFPTKLSILLSLITIFIPARNGVYYRFIQMIILLNALDYTSLFFLAIFACTPRAKIWTPYLPDKCIDYKSYLMVPSIYGFVIDIVMFALPLWWVSGLKLSPKRKVGIMAMFGSGLLAIACSTATIYASRQNSRNDDSTWNLTILGCAGTGADVIESLGDIAAQMIIGNMQVLPRFYTHFRHKLFPPSDTSMTEKALRKNSLPPPRIFTTTQRYAEGRNTNTSRSNRWALFTRRGTPRWLTLNLTTRGSGTTWVHPLDDMLNGDKDYAEHREWGTENSPRGCDAGVPQLVEEGMEARTLDSPPKMMARIPSFGTVSQLS
ncbi:hypothetical protein MMC25_008320 [Agyrium rufum]|nr:hypothetical protein [Agyrium rufum]